MSGAASTVLLIRQYASTDGDTLVSKGLHTQLIPCLSVKDEETVLAALEALFFLSSSPAHRPALARTDGLFRAVLPLRQHKTPAMRNVATTILEQLYEFASESDRTQFEPVKGKSVKESTIGTSMAQVSNICAKTYRVTVDPKELREDPFLDKKMVRAKGVISIQIDRDASMITLCTNDKTINDIEDLLDAYDISVDIKDIEEVDDEKENENEGMYLRQDPSSASARKQRMLSRVNGESVQARIDSKMRKKQEPEQKGWLASLVGW